MRSFDSEWRISDSEHDDPDSSENGLRRLAGPPTIEGAISQKEEEHMARQSQRERNAKQRERQRLLRDRHKIERRPARDDFARILLFRVISGLLKTGKLTKLGELEDELVGELVTQGFDERAAYEVFSALVEQYGSGDSPFRRKVHLVH
ncbi:hypothetical protein [Rhizobium bangladeshense]|uniref:hypothetical protein n=1 Tax=Rhizobium bangladeshense TaxID=1138189 RepID=UPI002180ADE8|nr:hypothetical protein [Rhizobium bangladeshense]